MTHLTEATVYEAIAHGDDTHRAWLNEALENLWEGKPVPEPRGTNVPTEWPGVDVWIFLEDEPHFLWVANDQGHHLLPRGVRRLRRTVGRRVWPVSLRDRGWRKPGIRRRTGCRLDHVRRRVFYICREKHCWICDSCGEWFPRKEPGTTIDGEAFCAPCAKELS